LWNERGKAFSDYQKRLADSGDPGGSWRSAFPEFDPDKPEAIAALDKELDRYRFGARFVAYPVQAESDGRFSQGPVTSSDLHLLLLGARIGWPSEKAERETLRRSIIDEAFAEDPGSPATLSMRSEKVDVAALGEAVRARPADYRGWLILGGAAPAAEREAALRKAVDLNPENARSLNELAWLLVTSGRAKEALPFANRALDLAPWSPEIVDTLAEVASRLGKCAEALQLERRAVASGGGEDLLKRQAEIEQRCQTAAK
jgi:tetratricopeptide (TPR) repeat protein